MRLGNIILSVLNCPRLERQLAEAARLPGTRVPWRLWACICSFFHCPVPKPRV